jgi:hypothetical protein
MRHTSTYVNTKSFKIFLGWISLLISMNICFQFMLIFSQDFQPVIYTLLAQYGSDSRIQIRLYGVNDAAL